ncbi:MAG: hypothetical protein OXN25_15425 [Candidatus Poribacteria bacterium]|nr:hypothetical protein [Candidatus Poribacteria bacterium]
MKHYRNLSELKIDEPSTEVGGAHLLILKDVLKYPIHLQTA